MGSFGISEGNITGREKKKKKTQYICLTAAPSGEVAQTLKPPPASKGLNMEVWVACLG